VKKIWTKAYFVDKDLEPMGLINMAGNIVGSSFSFVIFLEL
jgi:hypothetical protein